MNKTKCLPLHQFSRENLKNDKFYISFTVLINLEMKKLVLFAAVIVAVSFASCKQKVATPEPVAPAVDTTAVVTQTPTDTTVAVAVQEAK